MSRAQKKRLEESAARSTEAPAPVTPAPVTPVPEEASSSGSSSSEQLLRENQQRLLVSHVDWYAKAFQNPKALESMDLDDAIALQEQLIEVARSFNSNGGPRKISETKWHENMRQAGKPIEIIKGDGNCLFRAVSHQLYRTEDKHLELRQTIVDYIEKQGEDYFNDLNMLQEIGSFELYCTKMRRDGEWGTMIEIQAIMEYFARPVQVFHESRGTEEPWQIYGDLKGKKTNSTGLYG